MGTPCALVEAEESGKNVPAVSRACFIKAMILRKVCTGEDWPFLVSRVSFALAFGVVIIGFTTLWAAGVARGKWELNWKFE